MLDYSIFDRSIRGNSQQYYDFGFIFSGEPFVFMQIRWYQNMFFQLHNHSVSGHDFTISVRKAL